MRKFDQPFDSYQLSAEKPINVELTSQRGHYHHLIDNPIYYFYAFQYTHGEFYRAVLGYETIWDTKYEDQLMLALDFLLNRWAQQKLYYLEEIQIGRKAHLEIVKWFRGVKPRSLNLRQRRQFRPGPVRALARVNLLDQPHHVDIELHTGEVFTVVYMHYLRLKHRKHIRSLDHRENTPGTPKSYAKDDGTSTAERLKGLGREVAFEAIHAELSDMRQRRRRQRQVQKAFKKVCANLV